VETAVLVRKIRWLNAPPGCDAESVMPPSTRELASRLCVLNDKPEAEPRFPVPRLQSKQRCPDCNAGDKVCGQIIAVQVGLEFTSVATMPGHALVVVPTATKHTANDHRSDRSELNNLKVR
jgi:hypothetical protein